MANKKQTKAYNALDYGKDEVALVQLFNRQLEDARKYFLNFIKPRLDRSYKLYLSDNRDRQREIQSWQSNFAVPYIFAVVETLKPRILDARPDFSVQGRNIDDQDKAVKVQNLCEYNWEIARGDKALEDVVSSSLIYGTGFLQTFWKKDVRKLKFLESKDLTSNKFIWKEKEQTFFDAPMIEWRDNYGLWYDWHNIARESKQYWFNRLILTKKEIERRYSYLDKNKLEQALVYGGKDLTNYASVRQEIKLVHEKNLKNAGWTSINKDGSNSYQTISFNSDLYNESIDELKMHEVFEWTRPFDDAFCVFVNGVPCLKESEIPFPYDFKESNFIEIPFVKIPGEFEGYGLPMLLENPYLMTNQIKNQRVDAATMNIHKMWIVNPLANINKSELISRPYGIVYSTDPNGAREIQTTDIKQSAYREEELLKSDMRYASGVDDFSMGVGGSQSATGIRHLRESTLERVRLFINHLGDGLSVGLRQWVSMYRQFMTDKMILRITGENGKIEYPIIEKDDLLGEYDFKATVVPSIAGAMDVKKKQDMDLLQLLMNDPDIDRKKLMTKVLYDFGWEYSSLAAEQQPEVMPTEEGLPQEQLVPTETAPQGIDPNIHNQILSILGDATAGQPSFQEASSPVDLLKSGAMPPTVREQVRTSAKTTNPRGLSRKVGGRVGKVNTNITLKDNSDEGSRILNRVANIQR